MSRVLLSVWFRMIQRIIQSIIQNTTSILLGVLFRIQGIIQKCPGNYSASGSVFIVLFIIRPAASGSGFSVLLKMPGVLFIVWFRIQRIIKKCPGYYSASGSGFIGFFFFQGIITNTTSVLFDVWFSIQGIIQKCPGYYSASGSVFSVFLKNVQGIIQCLVQYSGYYSKYDQQRLVQDSAYY